MRHCMKRKIILTFTAIMLLSSLTVFAVSYPPQLYHRAERQDKFKKGDIVYMFHSGTNDIKETIHAGDSLTVYRISPSCEMTPIGIIKVISYIGETHLKGEVFAGEIKPDDIAKKDKVSCLVISAGVCNP